MGEACKIRLHSHNIPRATVEDNLEVPILMNFGAWMAAEKGNMCNRWDGEFQSMVHNQPGEMGQTERGK